MESFDELKLDRYINKALLEKSFGRTELYDTLLEIAKAQQGVYVNNAVNRKLGIVGFTLQEEKGYRGRESRLNQDNGRPL